MQIDTETLDGIRVLAVEDEFLLQLTLVEDLRGYGATIVGPFGALEPAREAAASERFDVAVLDVNVSGDLIYPLAEDLLARGQPFVLLTGYATSSIPERFRSLPHLSKPYDRTVLKAELLKATGRA